MIIRRTKGPLYPTGLPMFHADSAGVDSTEIRVLGPGRS